LFSTHLPEALVDIARPALGASASERQAAIDLFNTRAIYRHTRLKSPGSDGVTRWQCLVCAGRGRSRDIPKTMRRTKQGPLIDAPTGKCCDGTVTAGADALPWSQPTIYGTSAWHDAYGRRPLVETVNSFLHGGFVDIDRGFVRLLNSGRITLFMTATAVGLNRWRVRRWERMHRLLDPTDPEALPPIKTKHQPKKNRHRHFEDVLTAANSPPPA
jgi:hypothetical protein